MNKEINNLKAIIFDFDGTIVDSNKIKEEAFFQIFLEFGEDVAKIGQEYHRENLGLNRIEKFRFVITNFTNIRYDENLGQKLSRKFSDIVFQKMKDCEYIEYAITFIESYHKKYMLFISSAMPDSELQEIVKHKDIFNYFKDIKGYPAVKSKFTKDILSKYGFKPDEIIFVGDAQSDFEAANENLLNFICVGETKINGVVYEFVNDFHDLERVLGL